MMKWENQLIRKKSYFSGKFYRFFLILIVILVLIFILNKSFFAKNLISESLAPFTNAGSRLSNLIREFPELLLSKEELIKENEELQNMITQIELDSENFIAIQNENKELRGKLGLKPTPNSIVSRVLGHPPQVPLDTLLLDKGEESGVKVGDQVFVSDRVLLGKIVEATKNQSTVALNSLSEISNYGFLERTGYELEIKGSGAGSMKARAPTETDILVGDNVLVDKSFSLVIGRVAKINEELNSGFKDVYISLPVLTSKITLVFIESI